MSRTKDKSLEAVFTEVEKALDTIENSRIIVKLLAIRGYKRYNAKELSSIFKTQARTIYKWIELFKLHGVAGLIDNKKGHRPALISSEQQVQIRVWIETSQTPQGDPIHWTLGLLCVSIAQEFGITIQKSAMANTLKRMGIALRRPRPSHIKSDPNQQAEFKKNS